MNAKELKALAKACRAAGIKTFKNQEVEITLADETPVSNYKKRMVKSGLTTKPQAELKSDAIESDGWESLSLEQKLLWSSDSTIDHVESNEQWKLLLSQKATPRYLRLRTR